MSEKKVHQEKTRMNENHYDPKQNEFDFEGLSFAYKEARNHERR